MFTRKSQQQGDRELRYGVEERFKNFQQLNKFYI